MIFAPFAYKQQAVSAAPPTPFNPNDLTDLTFWIDFSDTSFLALDGTQTEILSAYSIVANTINATLSRVNGSNYRYSYVNSLSNSSLRCAKVINRPTSYRSNKWNNGVAADATFGPKTNTTSYPDGSMFIVLNRGTISTAGYIISRYNGSTDRGVIYDLATGSPNTDLIGYDYNSPAYQYYNTTANAHQILTRVNDSATSTIYRGSSQQATGSKNDTQDLTTRQFHNLGIYGSPGGSGDATAVNEHYCEIIIYNRVLNSTELNQVWNYLSNKWTISL
jgi:hypothetical protein